MNKNFLKVAVVAVVAFVAGLNVYHSQTEVRLTDIQMENVEALAGGENGGNNARYAWSREISCPGWFSGSYRVCQENGPGNECYEPGATTCNCGVNC